MLPQTYLYRHDDVITPRPFAFDVDERDWLWEGVGRDLLGGHNLRTGERKVIRVPELGNQYIFQALVWGRKLVCTLGFFPDYLVYDLDTGAAFRRRLPGKNPVAWYGRKTPTGKLMLFERSENQVLILDAPDAEPRAITSPYPGQFVVGDFGSDGLMYLPVYQPSGLIRFDPVREKFVDRIDFPDPEAAYTGTYGSSLEIGGIRYFANNTNGDLQPLDMKTQRWLEPIPNPDFGKVFGWIATAFTFRDKAHFFIGTLKRPTRIEKQSMKLDVSGLFNTTDGQFSRFLGAHLVFDPQTRSFEYLEAPPQPDGVPLLCYWWTDGERFAITGIVIPFDRRGHAGMQEGPWIVLQSEPANEEPALGPHALSFTHVPAYRKRHEQSRRRDYPSNLPLYVQGREEAASRVAGDGEFGPAVTYPAGVAEGLVRRRAKTDAAAYWRDLAHRLAMYHSGGNPATLQGAGYVKRVAGFVQQALIHNPGQSPAEDPIIALEAHEGRPAAAVSATLELLRAGGVEARRVELREHVVAEAFYDGSWHLVDALAFGWHQPTCEGVAPPLDELRLDPTLAWQTSYDEPNIYLGRPSKGRAGRVLSVEELRADPYFADGFAAAVLAPDEDLLRSEDGYALLGDVLGPWGSRPYYSYFLGGERECPPTVPVMLPAVRLGGNRVRLRWSESVRHGGGRIEYLVRVCEDRDCLRPVLETATPSTSWEIDVPGVDRVYYVEVRAADDHRKKNPNTWYPAARSNFVLASPERPGWHGLI